ncbi:MAG: hypothetical protein B0W54_23890 [Cellvibrio sp. 79]|nr:MAG: hypothetical protein B0W54_23890 [Cellvibrio sp. 79]
MTSIEIIDDTQHRELCIDFQMARRAFRQEVVPVVISEFHSLMFHYPIVLVKDGDTGEFTCAVLLGINSEANLLDEKDVANDEILPLNIRRLPLVAVAPPDGESRPLIAINMASPGVGQGEYIFKSKSHSFEAAIFSLGELYGGYKETRDYVNKIVELDLVSTLHAQIRHADKPAQILEGLYAIDLNKIAQLVECHEANKNSFLEIARYAYAQHFSLSNMARLAPLVS